MTIEKLSPLRRFWNAWLRFGEWLGEIMSWVWMPLFYFLFLTPFAIWTRLFKDPLAVKGRPRNSYWTEKRLPPFDIKWAKNQGNGITPDTRSK
jgi:hypothetical protein